VSRRLDRHQADSTTAFNTLQGEMSKLTEMMVNMQSNFSRFAPPEHMNHSYPTHPGQNRTFVTPSPPGHTVLSPIMEGHTPVPTPPNPKPPPFPPNLGNLTPDQLPMPPHSQPARHIAHTTTTAPPITSTMPSSSSQPHFSQTTNPITQPFAYNPPNNPYTPNSQQQYSPYPPYYPPPPPYPYPYPSPQYNHFHNTNPYPHTETNNHSNHQHNEPHLRTPHVELPIFQGENPRAWILDCEDIFSLVGITEDQRVRWGLAHVRGQAKTWLSTSGLNLQSITWKELC
jgi:hypothetical protein